MAVVGSTGSASSLADDLSIDRRNLAANEQTASDKDMFMRLMLAQMKNQNPLNPQDGTQFLSQLAQFSQLEGIGKINSSIQDMSSMFKSTQTLQATTLVGREVQVDGGTTFFDGSKPSTGIIKAGQAATDCMVKVRDSSGALVFSSKLGDIGANESGFAWDGADNSGNPLKPGNYTFSVEGLIGGKTVALETAMNQRVSSVSIAGGPGGGMMLNLAGGSSIGADKVTKIR
jgi:flagellar basal-body rod modification protein FlgD